MSLRRSTPLLALAGVAVALAAPARTASPQPVLALAYGRHPALVQLDPSTLARAGKKQLALGDYGDGMSLAPDGALLVLGSGKRSLRFVDARRLRKLGDVRVSLPANIAASAWFRSRVVLVSTSGDSGIYVRTVDAARRRVESLRTIGGFVEATGRSADALVLLLASGNGIGPTTLAVVPPDGPIRTVELAQVPSGWQIEEEPEEPAEPKVSSMSIAGLAVDPAGRAFVVGGGTPVAEVDLSSLAVTYHALPAAATTDAVRKGGVDGPAREARWLGGGLVGLTGADSHGWIDPEGRAQTRQTAAGLVLVDTRTWTARVLDPAATRFVVAADLLLVQGILWDSTAGTTANGLVAYGLDGGRRYQLEPGKLVDLQALGRRLIVHPSRPRFQYSIVDTETGRVLRTVRGSDPPYAILPGE